MVMRNLLTLCLFSFALPSHAACPNAPDITAAVDVLLEQVQSAPNERAARQISNQFWVLWTKAPDEKAQDLLDRGMQAREVFAFDTAAKAFDELVEYCPNYAEGYNQRAFVNFLQQNYQVALVDLDLAIARSPRHVAAIAGKALTLMGLEDDEAAQVVLREALALNPWLSERRFLKEPDGEEL
ncbi:MAG: hypothetical protein GKR98_09685 [Boseongicola sp.]|nr:MAG: hypothetical protein GKR98_09685 [Boseongicola sp.]